VQRCLLVNKLSNDDCSKMEKLTNLLNTNNCYRQVLKEHLKFMYNQLKYLTTVELQKQNSQLNKQIVRSTIHLYNISFKNSCFLHESIVL